MTTSFVGGALSFKGDKSKNGKKKKLKSKHSSKNSKNENKALEKKDKDSSIDPNVIDDMTEAEKKAMIKKLEREKAELSKVVMKSHRERVEEFNEKLSSLTELNDIPRVRLLHKRVLILVRMIYFCGFERIVVWI